MSTIGRMGAQTLICFILLLLLSGFLRRPPPELRVVSLDAAEILAA